MDRQGVEKRNRSGIHIDNPLVDETSLDFWHTRIYAGRMDRIEMMAAHYLSTTDIPATEVELVEQHHYGEDDYYITFFFRRREKEVEMGQE